MCLTLWIKSSYHRGVVAARMNLRFYEFSQGEQVRAEKCSLCDLKQCVSTSAWERAVTKLNSGAAHSAIYRITDFTEQKLPSVGCEKNTSLSGLPGFFLCFSDELMFFCPHSRRNVRQIRTILWIPVHTGFLCLIFLLLPWNAVNLIPADQNASGLMEAERDLVHFDYSDYVTFRFSRSALNFFSLFQTNGSFILIRPRTASLAFLCVSKQSRI